MKYSDIIKVKDGFYDVFDMISERENYWKRFVTNTSFERNLSKVIDVFEPLVSTDKKSIWIQGSYGTGKSHSSSVIKHLLADNFSEVEDFVKGISSTQLRSRVTNFRKNKRIFPIVLKGIYGISDSRDLKILVQDEVKKQCQQAGIKLLIKSDFEKVIERLKDKKYKSVLEHLVNVALSDYVSNSDDLFFQLENGDTDILKEVLGQFKADNIAFFTDNIEDWLREVQAQLRSQGVSDYLVIFWDEFTSLLTISERNSILTSIQGIAELSSKADIYLFLITHISLETTELFRSISTPEQNKVKDRFLTLSYDIQYETTYHILLNSIERVNPSVLDDLINLREEKDLSVDECLHKVTSGSFNPQNTIQEIKNLYPFHPYTAYISTFLARVVGASERSVFQFLDNDEVGFKAFLSNDVDSICFLTIEKLWDFFQSKFQELPKYSDVIDTYRKFCDKVTQLGENYLIVFKAILLLNIVKSTANIDSLYGSERNLSVPSTANIRMAFSGSIPLAEIDSILFQLDKDGVVLRNPEDIYEITLSSVPIDKLNSKKDILRKEFLDFEAIKRRFPLAFLPIDLEINSSISKRPCATILSSSSFIESALFLELDAKIFDNPGSILVSVFLSMGFDLNFKAPERTVDELKSKLIEISRRSKYQNVIFIQPTNTFFEENYYDAFISALAKAAVLNEAGNSEASKSHSDKALDWVKYFTSQVVKNSEVNFIFNGTLIKMSFTEIASKINTKIIPAIYSHGLDGLTSLPSTAWTIKGKPSPKTIETMLLQSRSEVEKNAGSKLKALLKNNFGKWIFDEDMNLVDIDESNPIVMLSNKVQEIMQKHENDSEIKITEFFQWIFEPPFGYLMNDGSFAAVALAFRSYTNRIYMAATGTAINALTMKQFILELFRFYLQNTSENPILTIRFSSKYTKELISKLVQIFALEASPDNTIIKVKWAIREQIKKNNKAPLWVLKYIPKKKKLLFSTLDLLFDLTQKQSDEIKDDDIEKLNSELESKQMDLVSALSEVRMDDCFDRYVEYWLSEHQETRISAQSAIESLKRVIGSDPVFWDEKTVNFKLAELSQLGSLPPHIHDWSNWIIEIEATPEILGRKKRTCNSCGEDEFQEIPMVEPQPENLDDQIREFLSSLDDKFNSTKHYKNAIKKYLYSNQSDYEIVKRIFGR